MVGIPFTTWCDMTEDEREGITVSILDGTEEHSILSEVAVELCVVENPKSIQRWLNILPTCNLIVSWAKIRWQTDSVHVIFAVTDDYFADGSVLRLSYHEVVSFAIIRPDWGECCQVGYINNVRILHMCWRLLYQRYQVSTVFYPMLLYSYHWIDESWWYVYFACL